MPFLFSSFLLLLRFFAVHFLCLYLFLLPLCAAAAADNRIDEYENFYCTYFTRYVVAHTGRLKYFSVFYIYVW